MKKLFFYFSLCLIGILCLAVSHLTYLYIHREFDPSDFYSHLSETEQNDANNVLKSEAKAILGQRFFYLSRGKQATAYESEDHSYVIKFFNPRRPLKKKWFLEPSRLVHFCSLKWFSNTYFKRKQRMQKLFHRYRMAFDELKEEGGLIYMHLGPQTAFSHVLHLQDQSGKEHALQLEHTPFILQKKVELAPQYFHRLLQNKDYGALKTAINNLKSLFIARAKKGFTDRVQTLHNNYGFIDGQAFQIDMGRLWKIEAIMQHPEEEIARVLNTLQHSLKNIAADLDLDLESLSN